MNGLCGIFTKIICYAQVCPPAPSGDLSPRFGASFSQVGSGASCLHLGFRFGWSQGQVGGRLPGWFPGVWGGSLGFGAFGSFPLIASVICLTVCPLLLPIFCCGPLGAMSVFLRAYLGHYGYFGGNLCGFVPANFAHLLHVCAPILCYSVLITAYVY